MVFKYFDHVFLCKYVISNRICIMPLCFMIGNFTYSLSTGTPLQNCLSEYFAMVDFIKPSLLGTFKEFQNRFVNPIRNGQHSDSTQRDVQIMKKRSFILSDLLKGCMQRRDYNVLVPYLQVQSLKHIFVRYLVLN